MAASHEAASSDRTAIGSVWPAVIRKWIARAIQMAGWGAATLALLGFAGAIARTADLASHFRILYVLAMVPALVTYLRELWRRKWQSAILTLVLALDSAAIVVLYLPSGQRPISGPEETLVRLLQFNTWPKNRDDESVLSLIEAERPDVAALQETSESLRTAVARRVADRYRILSAGSELLLIRRGAPSIHLQGWTRHHLPGEGEAITVRLGFAGREVAVLSFHAMAPLGLARAAARDAQFEWVARWCCAQSGQVIILGDLNATPWSHSFGRLLREGGLLDSAQGFGVQPTWRTRYGPLSGMLAWPLQIPIDHCLHTPGLVAVAREPGPACGSNHFPLLVTLQLAGTTAP